MLGFCYKKAAFVVMWGGWWALVDKYEVLVCGTEKILNALPQVMGNETRQPLWSSLENVLGADSFKKK